MTGSGVIGWLTPLRERIVPRVVRVLTGARADARPYEVDQSWLEALAAGNRLSLRTPSPDPSWKTAVAALGAELCHRLLGAEADLVGLRSYFDCQTTAEGRWLTPIDRVEHAMKGYPLLYLAEVAGQLRYRAAADQLATALREHRRTTDGSLPYQPRQREILVDTLAMTCPFLARYGTRAGDEESLALAAKLLRQFISRNVDGETHLPFHGYYADGPRWLGLHGWGRGTGWYLVGLVDTLAEMHPAHPDRGCLVDAYRTAAQTLRRFQRADGHWSWAILHDQDAPDSSTTALVGYSLARGRQTGVLEDGFAESIDSAARALASATRADGLVDGSLAECRGLGKYPQNYGPTPWAQGASTAFASLYLSDLGRRPTLDRQVASGPAEVQR